MSPNAGDKPWHVPQANDNQDDGRSTAGNVIDGAAEVTGGALEAASGALDLAGGCLDGCSGCSLAVLVTLSAAAGTAMAFFR